MYDRAVTASISDHRITHKLEDATNELAWYGFTTVPDLAPVDADAFDAGLRAWAACNDVDIHIGLRGGGVFAHLT